jgi:cytochrome c-type biogenesis protein CcmH
MKNSKKSIILFFLIGLVMLQASPALAKDTVNSVAKELIAPCCWRQSVADHDSEIARTMKSEIKDMLAEGLTKQQILDHYVKIYGEQILSSPPKTGFNLLAAYLLPIGLTLVTSIIVVFMVLKWSKKPNSVDESPLPEQPEDKELAQRVEEELKSFNKY